MRVMDNIDHFNLRSFDLNLMVAFDAMMQELSVTKSAEKLRIGQSAMSHNLSTLRVLLQDDLFVRVGQKMQPTAKARALAGPVRTALSQAQNALQASDCFDPATAERVFRLGVTGEMEMILLPVLLRHLQIHAPGTKLLSRTITTDSVDPMINNGELDFGFANAVEVGFASTGTGTYAGKPNKKLRLVGTMFPLKTGLMVVADTGINTIADLKAKASGLRIASEYKGSTIIPYYIEGGLANGGMKYDDFIKVPVSNFVKGIFDRI